MSDQGKLRLSTLKPGDSLTFNGGDGEFEFRVAARHPGGPLGSLYSLTDGWIKFGQLIGMAPFMLDTRQFCAALDTGFLLGDHGRIVVLVTTRGQSFKLKQLDCESFDLTRASGQPG